VKKLLLITVLGLLAAGCTRTQIHQRYDKVDQATIGYIAGSLGRDLSSPPLAGYQLSICDTTGKGVAGLNYLTMTALKLGDPKIEEPDYNGDAFVVAVPAGDYRICRSTLSDKLGDRRFYFDKLTIPLKIEAGKVNYIGRYAGTSTTIAGLFGPVVDNAYWVVTDNQVRDMPAILMKMTLVSGLPVVTAIPAQNDFLLSVFQRR